MLSLNKDNFETLQWLKFKNIHYSVLNTEQTETLGTKFSTPLSEALPIIYTTDPLVKYHNKLNSSKKLALIKENDVIAFLRTDNELRSGQKITYYYYRTVKELNVPLESLILNKDEQQADIE